VAISLKQINLCYGVKNGREKHEDSTAERVADTNVGVLFEDIHTPKKARESQSSI